MSDPREKIGECEGFCGRVDHHLIGGLCPQCREKMGIEELLPELTAEQRALGAALVRDEELNEDELNDALGVGGF